MNTVVSVGATVVFMAMVVYALMERAQARKKRPASWTSRATSDSGYSGSWSFFGSPDGGASSHDAPGSCGVGDSGGGNCGGGGD